MNELTLNKQCSKLRFAYFISSFAKGSNMRKRFTQQLSLGQIPIEEAQIDPKSKNALNELLAALHAIYCDQEYNEQVFSLLERHISGKKKKNR